MNEKICIVGAFDFVNMPTGGQPVKTREFYYAMCNEYGEENIRYIDTYGWKKHIFSKIFGLFKNARDCHIFIMLPAHNGVKVFSRLLLFFKQKYKTQIFYDVIGGWLDEAVKANPTLGQSLKLFDGIWVETNSMHSALVKLGFNNVDIVPNFKKRRILDRAELKFDYSFPLRVCTFSRVCRQKGIGEAICTVSEINSTAGRSVFALDIYGPIDGEYETEFKNLIKNSGGCVEYKGIASPTDNCDILKQYFAVLFPTRFYTEGIPGTLVDAYAAGTPVISSLWKNCGDVFADGETGWGYEFYDKDGLKKTMLKAAKNPETFLKMRSSCVTAAEKYSRDNAMRIINRLIEKEG